MIKYQIVLFRCYYSNSLNSIRIVRIIRDNTDRQMSRFHTEHRGLVDVKGKGRLDTYWLLGKEGGVGKWSDTEWSEYSSEEGPAYMKDISEMPVKQ